jgi:adenosine deaminase
MSKNIIPIEINLYSNEFILKVKEDRHPVMLYKKFNVPIVISTDDEGILRTNLIEQYVLLAKRYKEIKYADIKQIVYNSIHYSFIKEPELKKKIRSRLDTDFKNFEKKILDLQRNHKTPGYIIQHSGKLNGTFTANPPSAVSLYLLFISCAVSHIVLITPSNETLA